MRIEKVRVKNFRCFEQLECQLHPQCNIFVGINGAGKSTILEALAVALGGFLTGIDGIRSNYIMPSDVHYKMYQAGTRVESQGQFPVEVWAQGVMGEKDMASETVLEWQRELNGKKRRTTHGHAKAITDYSRNLIDQVRNGSDEVILPLIAYYGTGRLWLQRRPRASHEKNKSFNRQMGYVDCLAAESNVRQMMQWFEEMTYIQLQEGKLVPELEAVKLALKECYKGANRKVEDASVWYDVKSRELVIQATYQNYVEKFPIRMLSDGEKGILSLVADIAYRMALLNPILLENVLDTPGVVLIDEIDLHLHPAWQKRIVNDLMRIFPNIQFIMTTHSPSILVNVARENIWLLDHYQLTQPEVKTYGRSVEEILREVMDVDVVPEEIRKLQDNFDKAIDAEEIEAAQQILERMRYVLGDNAEAVIENQIILDVER